MDPNINFGELRHKIPIWTIDDEEKILNKLKSFTDSYCKSADNLNRNLQCFSNNLNLVANDYYSSINTLRTLSLKKFFEHKVDKTEIKQREEIMPQQPFLTHDEAQKQTEEKFRLAIAKSLEALPLLQNQGAGRNDAESMYDDGQSETGTKLFSKGIDKTNRNLKIPHIIGTAYFSQSETCGLCIEDDDIHKKETILKNNLPKIEDMKDGQEYIIGDGPALLNVPTTMTISQISGPKQDANQNIPVAKIAMTKVSSSGVPVPPPMNLPMPVVPKAKPGNAEGVNQPPAEKKVLQCHQPQKPAEMDFASMLKQKVLEKQNKENGIENEQPSSDNPNLNPSDCATIISSTRPVVLRTDPNVPVNKKNINLNQYLKPGMFKDDEDDEEDIHVTIFNKSQQDMNNKQIKDKSQMQSMIQQQQQEKEFRQSNKTTNFFDIKNDDKVILSNTSKKDEKLNNVNTKFKQIFEDDDDDKKEENNIAQKTSDLSQKLNMITNGNSSSNNNITTNTNNNIAKGTLPLKPKSIFNDDDEEEKPKVSAIPVKLNPIDEMKRKLEENAKKKEISKPSYEPIRSSKPSSDFSERMSGLVNMLGGRMPGAPVNTEIRQIVPENTNKDEPELTEKSNIEELLDQKVVVQKKKPKRKGFNADTNANGNDTKNNNKSEAKAQSQLQSQPQVKPNPQKQTMFSSNGPTKEQSKQRAQPQPQAKPQQDLRTSTKTYQEPQKKKRLFFDDE